MIKDEQVAIQVKDKLNNAYRLLEEIIWQVNEAGDPEEAEAIRMTISKVFSVIVFDLMEPLYQAHPRLKPDDWED